MVVMISLTPCEDREEWDEFVLDHDGHPLQLWGWGDAKQQHGWQAERLIATDLDKHVVGGAQVLLRKLPYPLIAVAYVPRGPVGELEQAPAFLEALASYIKSRHRAVVLTIEPEWTELPQLLGENWQPAPLAILSPSTVRLDLTESEDALLAGMSDEVRRNIGALGASDEPSIRQLKSTEGLDACLDVYRTSVKKAGKRLHKTAYYHDLFDCMGDAAPLFAAYENGQPVAFIWLAISGTTAFELYEASTEEAAGTHVTEALRWHAIRKVRDWGLEYYDMHGTDEQKRGFAEHETRFVGAYERPLSGQYAVWRRVFVFGDSLVNKLNKR